MTNSTAINKRFLQAVDAILSDTSGGKYTKAIIAADIGTTNSNINRLATDPNRSITLEQAAKFCELYEVSTDWLLLGAGSMWQNTDTVQITITSDGTSPIFKKVVKQLTAEANKITKKNR